MSWYLANEDGILYQFASISGLIDLRDAAESYPALKDFFEVGATKNTTLCQFQLYRLAKKTKIASVKSTAKGLADMLRGQTLVCITDGTTGHPGSKKLRESALPDRERIPGRPLNHPDHARLIDPIKKRVRRIVERYFRRQEQAILDDVRLRFHVGKEYRESDTDGDKRAVQLLPDSLSPLTFAVTAKEDDDYMAQIKLAVERAEKQMQQELETSARIPPTKMSAYLRQNSLSKLTGELSETSKQRLRDAIADAIDAGETADGIVAAIQGVMEDFSTRRSSLIAQQEVNTAYNWSRHEIADQSGCTGKFWQVENITPCPLCVLNMSQSWIEFDEAFLSGDMMPPGHVGCFCAAEYRIVSSGEGR